MCTELDFPQAACGVTAKPEDQIVNIDVGGVNDDLAVVEYVDDIYKFYKLTEVLSTLIKSSLLNLISVLSLTIMESFMQDESRVHDYFNTQPDINVKMRSILIDWLIDVHRRFELMPETLYLTINIVDRYLSMKIVSRRELQLVGMSSMLLACKYEESYCLQVAINLLSQLFYAEIFLSSYLLVYIVGSPGFRPIILLAYHLLVLHTYFYYTFLYYSIH